MCLPPCVNSKVPYEGQPSTMESSTSFLKKHVEPMKETQKVHQTHATNAKN